MTLTPTVETGRAGLVVLAARARCAARTTNPLPATTRQSSATTRQSTLDYSILSRTVSPRGGAHMARLRSPPFGCEPIWCWRHGIEPATARVQGECSTV